MIKGSIGEAAEEWPLYGTTSPVPSLHHNASGARSRQGKYPEMVDIDRVVDDPSYHKPLV